MAGIIIFPDELSPRWVRQIIDSGLDFVALHPALPSDSGKDYMTDIIERMQDPAFTGMIDELRSAGVVVEFELHTMSWLLPRGTFHIHPEWFRMKEDGTRTADFNLCPSSEEALQMMEDRAAELAKILPSPQSHRYFFWLDDVASASCYCPACSKLSPADQAMTVYNRILKGIRRTDPFASQCYLAYVDTITAPEYVKPEEGIFLEYAPIGRMSGVAINDPRCPQNVDQTRGLRQLMDVFGTKNSQVLEYWLDNSRFYGWREPYGEIPFYKSVIKQDAAFYRSLGFEKMTCFACRLGDDYVERYGLPPIAEYVNLLK